MLPPHPNVPGLSTGAKTPRRDCLCRSPPSVKGAQTAPVSPAAAGNAGTQHVGCSGPSQRLRWPWLHAAVSFRHEVSVRPLCWCVWGAHLCLGTEPPWLIEGPQERTQRPPSVLYRPEEDPGWAPGADSGLFCQLQPRRGTLLRRDTPLSAVGRGMDSLCELLLNDLTAVMSPSSRAQSWAAPSPRGLRPPLRAARAKQQRRQRGSRPGSAWRLWVGTRGSLGVLSAQGHFSWSPQECPCWRAGPRRQLCWHFAEGAVLQFQDPGLGLPGSVGGWWQVRFPARWAVRVRSKGALKASRASYQEASLSQWAGLWPWGRFVDK